MLDAATNDTQPARRQPLQQRSDVHRRIIAFDESNAPQRLQSRGRKTDAKTDCRRGLMTMTITSNAVNLMRGPRLIQCVLQLHAVAGCRLYYGFFAQFK